MRKTYPSDVTDDEWAFRAPYLRLMTEDAARTVQSTVESVEIAFVDQGYTGDRMLVKAAPLLKST